MAFLKDIHGQFFYEMLRHEDLARDFLHHYLPRFILEEAKLETLRLVEETSYNAYDLELEEELYALNFEIDLKSVEFFFCILVLHRSHVDENVVFHLFGKVIKTWKHYIDSGKAQYNEKTQTRNMPLVIPFVFYHDLEEWDVGFYLTDQFPHAPEALKKIVFDFKYFIFDLSKPSREVIKGGPYTRMFLDVARHIYDKDFSPVLERAFHSIAKLKKGQLRADLFLAMIEYIVRVRGDLTWDMIRDMVYKRAPHRASSLLTPT